MNPALPEQPVPTPPPSRFGFLNNRRRKVMAVLIVLLAIVALIMAIQSWRVLSAIVDVEHSAVVPLPPSDIALATATALPTLDLPTEIPVVVSADATHVATEALPTVVPPTATSAPASPADESPPLSPLDVARQLVDAGINGGDPGNSDIWGGKTELNILVLGVDKRADGGDQNADVIILAHLDLIDHKLSGISLPRDLEVEIPGIGPDKINGAYNYGVLASPDDPVAGVAKVRDTVESLFGIPIDGYVLVDFSGFSNVVDAMGGITVDVPYEIVDNEYPTEDYGITSIHFDAGVQKMDGEQALIYVRTRHADSDDARRQRQLDVIRAIFDQGKSVNSIANADEIILSAGGAIQTSFDLEEQLTLARVAYEMSDGDIQLTTLGEPLLQAAWSDDGRWIYTGDPEAIKAFVLNAIRTDGDGTATPVSGS